MVFKCCVLVHTSTDISVLKLELVSHYVFPTGDVAASFVSIGDLCGGTSETIVTALLDVMNKKLVDVSCEVFGVMVCYDEL